MDLLKNIYYNKFKMGKLITGVDFIMNTKKNFGEKLQEIRIKEKMTQAQFGEELGISTKTVISYESGKAFPKNIKFYKKVSERFNIPLKSLIDEYIEDLLGEMKILDALDDEGLFTGKTRLNKEELKELNRVFKKCKATIRVITRDDKKKRN
jgi:transcriptional regulator with XRE-family HTH domain